MIFKKKSKVIFFIIVLIAVFFTAGISLKLNNIKSASLIEEERDNNNQKITVEEVKKTEPKKIQKFSSNKQIKDTYGKLETVHLWNGKTYTGAVINTSEQYTIVTTQGIKIFPIKDIRLREIIK